MSRAPAIRDLSPFQQLLMLIGEDQAVRLTERLGGRRLYVPRAPGAAHPLSEAVGIADAQKVAGLFGGEHLDIPLSASRRERIVKLRARGLTVEQVRRAVGCSRRLVFLALEEHRDGSGPPAPADRSQLKLL